MKGTSRSIPKTSDDRKSQIVSDDYFAAVGLDNIQGLCEKVQAILGLELIGRNPWSRNHIQQEYLIFKQVVTGEINEVSKMSIVKRVEFDTLDCFLSSRNIILDEEETIPTRDDVEELLCESNLDKKGFIVGKGYVFRDKNDGIGIFSITIEGGLEIVDTSYSVYVRVRCIKKIDLKKIFLSKTT